MESNHLYFTSRISFTWDLVRTNLYTNRTCNYLLLPEELLLLDELLLDELLLELYELFDGLYELVDGLYELLEGLFTLLLGVIEGLYALFLVLVVVVLALDKRDAFTNDLFLVTTALDILPLFGDFIEYL